MVKNNLILVSPSDKPEIVELAQKLFNEAGYSGNVYKADPKLLRRFENQALEILGEE